MRPRLLDECVVFALCAECRLPSVSAEAGAGRGVRSAAPDGARAAPPGVTRRHRGAGAGRAARR